MSKSRDYLELSLESIQGFANDGRLDADEFARLLDIAERDGRIDGEEIRVLRNIIGKLRPEELDAPMRAQIARLAQRIAAQTAADAAAGGKD